MGLVVESKYKYKCYPLRAGKTWLGDQNTACSRKLHGNLVHSCKLVY